MNQGTKQRIVGTVVLLALALIFLPIIFDGEGSYQTPLESRIPEPPVITLLPQPEPTRPVIVADTDAITVNPSAPDAAAVTEPATETVAAEVGSTVPDAPASTSAEPEPTVAVVESEPVFTRASPGLDATGLPEGWSVRLGTFSEAANATALVARLQASGYRAYTREVTNAQARLTAVYVGPWVERTVVEDYQQKLQDEFQLSGMVVRYEIDKLVD